MSHWSYCSSVCVCVCICVCVATMSSQTRMASHFEHLAALQCLFLCMCARVCVRARLHLLLGISDWVCDCASTVCVWVCVYGVWQVVVFVYVCRCQCVHVSASLCVCVCVWLVWGIHFLPDSQSDLSLGRRDALFGSAVLSDFLLLFFFLSFPQSEGTRWIFAAWLQPVMSALPLAAAFADAVLLHVFFVSVCVCAFKYSCVLLCLDILVWMAYKCEYLCMFVCVCTVYFLQGEVKVSVQSVLY